jgi:hypothetical protein
MPMLLPMLTYTYISANCCRTRDSVYICWLKPGFSSCAVSFALVVHQMMPQHWIYIQSLSRVLSVRSLVESGYIYQQTFTMFFLGIAFFRWNEFGLEPAPGHQHDAVSLQLQARLRMAKAQVRLYQYVGSTDGRFGFKKCWKTATGPKPTI